MLEVKTLEELRKKSSKADKPRMVLAQNADFNRAVIEQKLVDVLVSPEKNEEKDSLKYLNGGINRIIAKIATRNNISIAIDLNRLRNLSTIELGVSLSRIRQNIFICRKSGTLLAVIGARDKLGAKALLQILGASTEQAVKAIYF